MLYCHDAAMPFSVDLDLMRGRQTCNIFFVVLVVPEEWSVPVLALTEKSFVRAVLLADTCFGECG